LPFTIEAVKPDTQIIIPNAKACPSNPELPPGICLQIICGLHLCGIQKKTPQFLSIQSEIGEKQSKEKKPEKKH
jgi:hypothetical protein